MKAGERNLLEASVRWAQVFKNKEGKEKFGYKLNLFAMKANDWEAENADRRNNPATVSQIPGLRCRESLRR